MRRLTTNPKSILSNMSLGLVSLLWLFVQAPWLVAEEGMGSEEGPGPLVEVSPTGGAQPVQGHMTLYNGSGLTILRTDDGTEQLFRSEAIASLRFISLENSAEEKKEKGAKSSAPIFDAEPKTDKELNDFKVRHALSDAPNENKELLRQGQKQRFIFQAKERLSPEEMDRFRALYHMDRAKRSDSEQKELEQLFKKIKPAPGDFLKNGHRFEAESALRKGRLDKNIQKLQSDLGTIETREQFDRAIDDLLAGYIAKEMNEREIEIQLEQDIEKYLNGNFKKGTAPFPGDRRDLFRSLIKRKISSRFLGDRRKGTVERETNAP